MKRSDTGPYKVGMQYIPETDVFLLTFGTTEFGETQPWDQQFAMQGTLAEMRAMLAEINEFVWPLEAHKDMKVPEIKVVKKKKT